MVRDVPSPCGFYFLSLLHLQHCIALDHVTNTGHVLIPVVLQLITGTCNAACLNCLGLEHAKVVLANPSACQHCLSMEDNASCSLKENAP